jgi:hypothetical protein
MQVSDSTTEKVINNTSWLTGLEHPLKVSTNGWMKFSEREEQIKKGIISPLMLDINTDQYFLLYEHAERIYYLNKHPLRSNNKHIEMIYDYKGHLLRELTSYLLNGSHDEKLDVYYCLLDEIIHNFYCVKIKGIISLTSTKNCGFGFTM